MNRNKVRFQLSLTEFIYNGCFAASNFLSVFLESIGFSAGQIGLTNSLISGIGIASQPTWGIVSDRIRSVRRCFMLCMLGTALCALGVPLLARGSAVRQGLMIAVLAAMYFFFHPSNMMMELWLVRVSAHPSLHISYGSIRSWASVGYAFFNLVFVPLVHRFSEDVLYYFLAGCALTAMLLASRIPDETESTGETPKKQRLRDMPFRSILNYWVVGYVIFEVLWQIPNNWRVTYMVYALPEFGAENSIYGALMFVAGLCEVPMLLLTRRLSDRTGWARPLVLTVVMMALEYVLYGWGHSLPVLFAAQLLRGFSFALYIASRHQYVCRLAPRGLEGSTVALVNTVSAVSSFLFAAAGGFLLEHMGTRPFFLFLSGLQLFSGLFFIAVHFVGVRVLKKALPDPGCALLS